MPVLVALAFSILGVGLLLLSQFRASPAEIEHEAPRVETMDRVVEVLWRLPALNDLTLTIDDRPCCALLGRNGAGKTTLLRYWPAFRLFKKAGLTYLEKPRAIRLVTRSGFQGMGLAFTKIFGARELDFFARNLDVNRPRAWPRLGWTRWVRRCGRDAGAAIFAGYAATVGAGADVFACPDYCYWTNRLPHSTTELSRC